MEEQLSSYSSDNLNSGNNKAVKHKRRIINRKVIKICICTLLIIGVLFKIVDHCMWPSYYEKYYKGLIKICEIDEDKAADGMSGWGYAPYEFSDGSRKCTLAYSKPSRGDYSLRIQLDNTGFFEVYSPDIYKEPIFFDNISYDYEIYAMVGRFGSVRYTGYIYIGGDEFTSGDPCGFDIKDNEVFDYHHGVSDDHKQIAETLKPEIMKIKNELQNEIIEKLKEQ